MEISIGKQKIIVKENFLEESCNQIRNQLNEYLASDRKKFKLTVNYPDSFTGEVMREMSKIPYGENQTYGEISQKLDTSAVAVGQACGRNPAPVIVPCHRVVSKNSIGGYHYGKKLKMKLLSLESANRDN